MASTKHSEQTVTEGIHIAHAFEVADIAARDALSLVAGDVGKIVKVASPLQYDLIVSQSAGVGTYTRIDVARDIDYQVAFQTADLTLTTATPGTDATDLSVTLGVGTWVVEVGIAWTNGAASTDGYRSDFTFDGTADPVQKTFFGSVRNPSSSEEAFSSVVSNASLETDFAFLGIAGRINQVTEHMTVTVTAAGTLTYRAAKAADAGADTIFHADNYLIARRKP